MSAWFQPGTNLDNAQFEVSQRVSQILNTLPPGIQQPFILKFDVTNIPVAQVAVYADDLDEKRLFDLAYNVIEPQLERLPGVASATVGGGKTREIEVRVHRDALRARGVAILDVLSTVRQSNLLLPSGHIKAGERDYNVFANSVVEDPRELNRLIVQNTPSGPVRLSDVAEIVDGTAEQSEIVRINGRRGVYLRVLKQPGANTIGVVDSLRTKIQNLRGVPDSVRCQISFDQSTYIRAAVKSLEHEAVQGGLLAIVVILFFLLSMRATAIVAVAIPLSIIATFVLLYFTGQSLNIFTLGGLALGVGRRVDDSLVELETILRHLDKGQNRRQAVLAAAQEVAMPILVSTITTIVVFFPVLFLFGVIRNLFIPLAMTISFALIMSFFVSRTVTPLLCFYLLKAEHHGAEARGIAKTIGGWLDRMEARYEAMLRWVLQHRAITIGGIGVFFVASMALGRLVGTEFFPDSDEAQFSVIYKGPIAARVEKTEEISKRIEAAVQKVFGGASPKYTTMLSSNGLPLGRTAIFAANAGPHAGNIGVNLVSKGQRDFSDVQAAEKLRAELRDQMPGVQLFFSTGGIVKRILNFGAQAPIDVEIVGYDLEEGSRYAKVLQKKLRELNGNGGQPLLTDLQISRDDKYPELDIAVDREKAGTLGLTEQQIGQTVLASLVGTSGFAPVPYTDPKTGNEYQINVKLAERFRDEVAEVGELFVRSPTGGLVALDSVAKIKRNASAIAIGRKYMQRIIDVTANVAPGQDLGLASREVARVMAENPPPEGFTVQQTGQVEAQKDAFSGLLFAGVMALLLVYMVLASQFKSLVDPLVIMFSVPLGLGGVFLALLVTGTTLSVNSFMGIIMMIGIVVSNGVLLVDFANVLRRRGESLVDATVVAGRTRLRPILMTTIATIFGLLPMALGMGEGSEANLPLARAVIGGLTVSTVFTLFLIPALYTVLEGWKRPGNFDDADDETEGGYAR